jgi:arsenate reductase
MAEGLARHLGKDIFEAYSAGTHPTERVNPNAVQVMEEIGIDLTAHYPKLLQDIPRELDILITMGCGVECPYLPNKHREDWGLEDPVGKPLEEFRKTRELVSQKMKELIKRIEAGEL